MQTVKKIFTVVIGTIIAAYGIDLAIHAGFGGATLAVMWEGFSKTFRLTIGQASFIIALLMIIFSFFYDRKQISWGTIIYQAVYSSFLDIFEPVLIYAKSPVVNFLLMILGLCLLALGAAIYSYADFGRGSYEAMTFSFVSRNGWQIKYVRITLDILCVIFGALLGGKFGLCTVATIVLSGPLLQFFLTRLQKYDPLKFAQKITKAVRT